MNIKEAYKKLSESDELKKQAIEAIKNGKGDEFLKKQGFDFTLSEIKEYLEKKKAGELTKAELDMAAGGCDSQCNTIVMSVVLVGIGCAISLNVIEGYGKCNEVLVSVGTLGVMCAISALNQNGNRVYECN